MTDDSLCALLASVMFKIFSRRLLASVVLVSLVVGLSVQAIQGIAMAVHIAAAASVDLPIADGCDDCGDDLSSFIDCSAWTCVGQAAIASEKFPIKLPPAGSFGDPAYTLYLGQAPGPDPHPPRRFLHA